MSVGQICVENPPRPHTVNVRPHLNNHMILIARICLFILCLASFETLLAQKVSVDNSHEELIISVESQPEFLGGIDSLKIFISNNIKITEENISKFTPGIVYTQFFVNENGYLLNPKILKTLNPYLDSLSIVAIKSMPRWIPAKQNGKPVGYLFNLPIKFEIN